MVKKVLFDMVMGRKIEKKIEKETISKAGIIMTNNPEEESGELTIEVLAIGSDVKEIEVGDKVLIQPYGNNEVTVNGRSVYIFRESVAICVLN